MSTSIDEDPPRRDNRLSDTTDRSDDLARPSQEDASHLECQIQTISDDAFDDPIAIERRGDEPAEYMPH